MSEKNKAPSFMAQAFVLAAASMITRILGFFYKLPIIDMLDDVGMGIHGYGANVYALFYIISSAGLPAAISRMVSARLAVGQHENAHKVFKTSLLFAFAAGLLSCILLFIGADFFANLMGSPDSAKSVLVLAPTVLITSILSAYRGYFQGMGNAVPTAVSQVVEQIFNAVFSIWLVYIFFKQGDIVSAAAGGNAGTGIGAFFGLLTICGIYLMARKRIQKKMNKSKTHAVYESRSSILKELLYTAFPIIAGAAIYSFTNIIDGRMIMSGLAKGGFTTEESLALSGMLTGKFNAITTLPVTISTTMATAIIPSISASAALNDRKSIGEKTNLALRLSMIISIPAAFGMGIFADQIYGLIFSGVSGAYLLGMGFFVIVLLALYQITTGILQGIGQMQIPIFSALMGCLLKIPVNYFLLPITGINIMGAVISTMVCYTIAAPINMFFACKFTGTKLDFKGTFVKPLLSSVIMSGVCYVTYYTLYYIYPSNAISLIIAIGVGVLTYGLVMVLTGGLTERELSSMPMGKKILKAVEWLLGKNGMKKAW